MRRWIAGALAPLLTGVVVVVATAVSGVPTAAADGGATAWIAEHQLHIWGDDSAQDLAFSITADGLTEVRNNTGPILASTDCQQAAGNVARCRLVSLLQVTLSGGNDRVVFQHNFDGTIDLGDGNDVARGMSGLTGNLLVVRGDAGNDTIQAVRQPARYTRIEGGSGVDTMSFAEASFCDRFADTGVVVDLDGVVDDGCRGTAGTSNFMPDLEVLIGTSGDDRLTGGPGNETINGLGGADWINGGTGGFDFVTYANHNVPVTVTLDAAVDDGAAGEGDFVSGSTIDGVIGGKAGDTIRGSSLNNTLNGGPGNDTIEGLGGNDFMDGAAGADSMSGGDGFDRVTYSSRTAGVFVDIDNVADDGGEGDNVRTDVEYVTGTQFGDSLNGSANADRLEGLGGNDILRGFDGNDTLLGGLGTNDQLNGGNHTDVCDLGPDGGTKVECES